jgi:hypothetical protein
MPKNCADVEAADSRASTNLEASRVQESGNGGNISAHAIRAVRKDSPSTRRSLSYHYACIVGGTGTGGGRAPPMFAHRCHPACTHADFDNSDVITSPHS